MTQIYHILNGDSLRAQFPNAIEGSQLVMRECLIEGNVKGDDLQDFFQIRSQFIQSEYGIEEGVAHYQYAIQEFEKIQDIPEGATVYLWFEDDLFCQVNLWFIVYLLSLSGCTYQLFLVRPTTNLMLGFGGMDTKTLIAAFENAQKIPPQDQPLIAHLWKYYQTHQLEALLAAGEKLSEAYPWLLPAIQAHVDRIPTNESPGRPQKTLLKLIEANPEADFGQIFRSFCQQECIYGFGDLQVKKMLDRLQASS